LIKKGMTSKEIAEALKLSALTVHKYRELIRKKLDLVNDETNLQTFLQSF
jgi:DNA-binding CsgD family transcriptional regulator